MRVPGAAAAALLLGACGFHLQGRAPLPDPVKTPYLEVPDRQSDFVQSLRRALLSNGAHLAREKGQASAVVSIVKDNLTRRVVSVSATNQPNQYEVTYTVGFSVSTFVAQFKWIVRADGGVALPDGLKGKTVIVTSGTNTQSQLDFTDTGTFRARGNVDLGSLSQITTAVNGPFATIHMAGTTPQTVSFIRRR